VVKALPIAAGIIEVLRVSGHLSLGQLLTEDRLLWRTLMIEYCTTFSLILRAIKLFFDDVSHFI
jgi:hypothetical protein